MPPTQSNPQASTPLPNDVLEEAEHISTLIDSIKSHMNQASDLAEMGAFSSMFAHEVNNLMTQVGGRAQLALMHMDQPERIVQALELACHASAQIAQLSEVFMCPTLAMSPGVTTDPIEAIHRRTLGFLLDQDITDFGFSLTGLSTAQLGIPAVLLQQVLLNLYLNAIRAIRESDSPTQGKVSIHIKAAESNCSTWNNCGAIQITVEDTGVGMTPTQISRLFLTKNHDKNQPTLTTDQGRGHGLGLAVCKKLLDNAQGSVKAESTPGAGTKMIITLPAAASLVHKKPAA